MCIACASLEQTIAWYLCCLVYIVHGRSVFAIVDTKLYSNKRAHTCTNKTHTHTRSALREYCIPFFAFPHASPSHSCWLAHRKCDWLNWIELNRTEYRPTDRVSGFVYLLCTRIRATVPYNSLSHLDVHGFFDFRVSFRRFVCRFHLNADIKVYQKIKEHESKKEPETQTIHCLQTCSTANVVVCSFAVGVFFVHSLLVGAFVGCFVMPAVFLLIDIEAEWIVRERQRETWILLRFIFLFDSCTTSTCIHHIEGISNKIAFKYHSLERHSSDSVFCSAVAAAAAWCSFFLFRCCYFIASTLSCRCKKYLLLIDHFSLVCCLASHSMTLFVCSHRNIFNGRIVQTDVCLSKHWYGFLVGVCVYSRFICSV